MEKRLISLVIILLLFSVLVVSQEKSSLKIEKTPKGIAVDSLGDKFKEIKTESNSMGISNEDGKLVFIDRSLFQETVIKNSVIDLVEFTQENDKNFLTITLSNKLHNWKIKKLIIPFNDALFLERFEDGLKIISHGKDILTDYVSQEGKQDAFILQNELKKFKSKTEEKSPTLVYFIGKDKNLFLIDRSPTNAPVKDKAIQDFIIGKVKNPPGTVVNAIIDYNEKEKKYTVSLKDIPVGTIIPNDLDTTIHTEKDGEIKISTEVSFERIKEIRNNQEELKPKEQTTKDIFDKLTEKRIPIIRFNILGQSISAIKKGREQEWMDFDGKATPIDNYLQILGVLSSEKASKLPLEPQEKKWIEELYSIYAKKGDAESLRKIAELEKVSGVKYIPGR